MSLDYYKLASQKEIVEKIGKFYVELDEKIISEKLNAELERINNEAVFTKIINEKLHDYWDFEKKNVWNNGVKILSIFVNVYNKIYSLKINSLDKINSLREIETLFEQIFKSLSIFDFNIYLNFLEKKEKLFLSTQNFSSSAQTKQGDINDLGDNTDLGDINKNHDNFKKFLESTLITINTFSDKIGNAIKSD